MEPESSALRMAWFVTALVYTLTAEHLGGAEQSPAAVAENNNNKVVARNGAADHLSSNNSSHHGSVSADPKLQNSSTDLTSTSSQETTTVTSNHSRDDDDDDDDDKLALKESEVITISYDTASCRFEEVIRNLTISPDIPQLVRVELSNELGIDPNDCWLRVESPSQGPPKISVLLLDQSCAVPGSVMVAESLGPGKGDGGFGGNPDRAEHFYSGRLVRHWVSCQRTISPGPDYVTSGRQVFLGFAVGKEGLYRAVLHVRTVGTATAGPHLLHKRYVSPTLGYIQNSGIHLHPSFLHRQMNMDTYSDDLDLCSHLTPPTNHVTLVSVAIASFGVLPKNKLCDDRLELITQGPGSGSGSDSGDSVLWTLCAEFESLPLPVLIGDSASVHVRFVSGHSRVTPSDYPLKHGCGVRVVFSFHRAPDLPRQVDDKGGTWNCSVDYWPDFQAHFQCNLLPECAGREDESGCFYTPCPPNNNINDDNNSNNNKNNISGVVVGDMCYSLHRAPAGVTWHEANKLCSNQGGRLAALKSAAIRDGLVRAFRLDLAVKTGQLVLVGVRTADTSIFLYRNVFQWTDKTVYFSRFLTKDTGNTFTLFGYLYPLSVGVVMTYFKALWKLQEDCKHYVCKYLCERKLPAKNSEHGHGDATTTTTATTTTATATTATATTTATTSATTPTTTQALGPKARPGDILLAATVNVSEVPFRFVHCPTGHITHTFLAFDPPSDCFDENDESGTECVPSSSLISKSSTVCRLRSDSRQLVPFTCANGLQRVPYTLVCNHVHDCQDDSDESFCSFRPCDWKFEYQCLNTKECHPQSVQCNGFLDCTDSSDETGCSHLSRLTKDDVQPPFLLRFEDRISIYFGYVDLMPLNGSVLLPCPDTHFRCPESRNCLPVYMRCNGVFDCSKLEDERGCEGYTCPNFYRCRGSQVCVHPGGLCDGMMHCPQQDDERFCRLACAEGCVCSGHGMRCHVPFAAGTFPELRFLDGSGSGMKMRDVANNSLLVHLELSGCNISHVVYDGVTLPNLLSLDLSSNQLAVLSLSFIHVMPELRKLLLRGNPLSSLFSTGEKHKLEELDISSGNLRHFDSEVLTSFESLVVLNLSHNAIEHLAATGSQTLPKKLRVLDTGGCPITTFPRTLFEGLNALEAVNADNYKLCCKAMLPPGFVTDNCQAPFDEVSSCEDLLRSNLYRVPLLVLACLALLGNLISFAARMVLKRGKTTSAFGVFVLHLCLSDFLMGVYLVLIGVADRVHQGRYLWEDVSWRHSAACKLAGCVSMTSSEVSAFMICLITLDRFIVLRFPFTRLRFGRFSAQVVSAVVWTTGAALAVAPLLPAMSHWWFYSQSGICIPLPITRSNDDFPGHGYAFGVMILLNFFLFLLIASGQAFIYVSIQSGKMSDSETGKKSQDATIARRLISVVVSDFLCWFPIGVLGLLARGGTPVPGEVNVAMAVLVLPLNSALNPFLYTLNMIQEHTARRNEEKLFQRILLHKEALDAQR